MARPCIGLSFSCFSHEFLVHINENVSFQPLTFLYLIPFGNLHPNDLYFG